MYFFFFFQAEDGIRDVAVTGVQTCALPIYTVFTGAPVKTVWTRDDDIRGGYYRSAFLHRAKVALGDDGLPTAWHRSEERRVGKECRSRWPPDHKEKKVTRWVTGDGKPASLR